MALTDAEVTEAARQMALQFYTPDVVATMNLDHLKAAIVSIDSSMATVISTIPTAWQSKTIQRGMLDALPEPFQSRSTAEQKAAALGFWAKAEAGAL